MMNEECIGLLAEDEDNTLNETQNIGGVYVQRPDPYPRQAYDQNSSYRINQAPNGSTATFSGDGTDKSEDLSVPGGVVVRSSHYGVKRRSHGSPAASQEANLCCRCVRLRRRLGLKSFSGLWCVGDGCGIVCAVLTWGLIFYAEFVVVMVMLLPSPSAYFRWINGIVYHVFSALAFLSHLKAMFSDPGTVSLGNATKENILRMGFREGQVVYKCPKCVSIKPDRSHHCSVCRRCIRKMDHHCPWINNCVGEMNQKHFVLFTLYICIMSFYSIYMCIHYFIMCLSSEWEVCQEGYSAPVSTIFMVFLIVEGLLFGIFTAIMFGEQIQSIWNDETGIENLKKEQATWEKKSRWYSMESVFGQPFSFWWFIPVAPALPQRSEVYLYSV